MRLSEAIRAGSRLRPMAKYDFFIPAASEYMGSCVLGAAYESLCGTSRLYFSDELDLALADIRKIEGALHEHWPILNQVWCEARPEWDRDGNNVLIALQEVIQDMNDSGIYTREEIADWLESIGE